MKWIRVIDKLPEDSQIVLIYDDSEVWADYERIEIATFYDSDPPSWFVYGKGDYHPTHWMPIPPKPKDNK